MSTTPDRLLALRVGNTTAGDNLKRAIDAGKVVQTPDGKIRLGGESRPSSIWVSVDHGPSLGCDFLMHFMFNRVYQRGAVPHGCSECYKVKVVLRTLRELVAAWELAKGIQCRSKWGIDLTNLYSQNVYAGYFYTAGLEGARGVYRLVRAAIDADPKLGSGVAMTIKRGCSEYEIEVGPSDSYTFTPEMDELEASLKGRFVRTKAPPNQALVLANWIDFAYRLGDETYLDFTNGRRRRAKTLTYTP